MLLKKALQQRPELAAEFRRICQPHTLSGDAIAAMKKHPLFAGVHIPDHINLTRREHGCPAKQGGARGPRAPIFYSVAGRGKACV